MVAKSVLLKPAVVRPLSRIITRQQQDQRRAGEIDAKQHAAGAARIPRSAPRAIVLPRPQMIEVAHHRVHEASALALARTAATRHFVPER